MDKRNYELEEVEAAWLQLPLWLRWKIAAIVAWHTCRRWTWEAWLKWAGGVCDR
jgi:hypothetical protein